MIGLGTKFLARFGCDLMKATVYTTRKETASGVCDWCLSLVATQRDLLPSTVSPLGSLPILQMCVLGHRWWTLIAYSSVKYEKEVSQPWHLDHKIMASDIYWESWRAQYMHGVSKVGHSLMTSGKLSNLFENYFPQLCKGKNRKITHVMCFEGAWQHSKCSINVSLSLLKCQGKNLSKALLWS